MSEIVAATKDGKLLAYSDAASGSVGFIGIEIPSTSAPLGPKSVLAIPSRNLLVASGEEDVPIYGIRSTMMIYEMQRGWD